MSRTIKTTLVAAGLAAGCIVTLNAQAQSRGNRLLRSSKAQQVRTERRTGAVGTLTKGGGQVVAELPDLVITRVDPDRDGYPPSTITVVNAGGLRVSNYSLSVLVLNGYGRTLYEIDIPNVGSLAPGQSRTSPLYTTRAYGASWSVRVDPQNRVREANERNNSWSNNRLR